MSGCRAELESLAADVWRLQSAPAGQGLSVALAAAMVAVAGVALLKRSASSKLDEQLRVAGTTAQRPIECSAPHARGAEPGQCFAQQTVKGSLLQRWLALQLLEHGTDLCF